MYARWEEVHEAHTKQLGQRHDCEKTHYRISNRLLQSGPSTDDRYNRLKCRMKVTLTSPQVSLHRPLRHLPLTVLERDDVEREKTSVYCVAIDISIPLRDSKHERYLHSRVEPSYATMIVSC